MPAYSWTCFSLHRRIEILDALVEMRRAGLLRVVWCDNWQIRVLYADKDFARRLDWLRANDIVKGFEEQRKCNLSNSERTDRRK